MSKVLFLGYSWNLKRTASSRFFIEYLQDHFDFDFVMDPEWNDAFVQMVNGKSPDALVFFQLAPPVRLCKKLACKNVIFVPMYDTSVADATYAWYARHFKTVAFSRKHLELCRKYHLPVYYLQYYPEPDLAAIAHAKDSILLWQRREYCHWNTLKNLIGEPDAMPSGVNQILLHSATDGDVSFIQPSDSDIAAYNIKVSTWFEDFSEYTTLLAKTALFVAPRDKEGIGMSFLDAMAKGAVIIAHNDATMNEYIDDSNGYLIDVFKPSKIDMSDWQQKQKASVERLVAGRKVFLEQLDGLAGFILEQTRIKGCLWLLSVACASFFLKVYRRLRRGF